MSQTQLHLFVKQGPKQIELNRSVAEADRPRLCRQARTIYERLKAGPVRTDELSQLAAQYNARIKEIRDYLRADGLTVDMIELHPRGNNLYVIRSFHGSHYEAELMKKQVRTYTKGAIV